MPWMLYHWEKILISYWIGGSLAPELMDMVTKKKKELLPLQESNPHYPVILTRLSQLVL
jgi:hypothetical protein